MKNESILVFNYSDIPNDRRFQGFRPASDWDYASFLAKIPIQFVERTPAVESDHSLKQFVSYIVLHDGDGRIFAYDRGKSGGEARLVSRSSIGVGGHVSLNDQRNPDFLSDIYGESILNAVAAFIIDNNCLYQYIRNEAIRELTEEINIKRENVNDLRLVGFIDDNSDEVGNVHFGVVYSCRIAHKVIPSENCLRNPRMQQVRGIEMARDSLEGWSKVLIDNISLII